MFWKLVVIILAVGAIGCGLLVVRQQRIEIAHEMSRIHGRMIEHEISQWKMRSEIAARTRPDDVRLALEQSGLVWTAMKLDDATDVANRFALSTLNSDDQTLDLDDGLTH